jgi:putative copper export protein
MALIIKAIVILLLVFVFFSLGSALYFLIRDRDNSDRIVKALTWRIGLSLLIFVILFIAFALGWIQPHSI